MFAAAMGIGAAPGVLNFATKLYLNTGIGTLWRLSVDVIYALILEEECGWVNALRTVMELIF